MYLYDSTGNLVGNKLIAIITVSWSFFHGANIDSVGSHKMYFFRRNLLSDNSSSLKALLIGFLPNDESIQCDYVMGYYTLPANFVQDVDSEGNKTRRATSEKLVFEYPWNPKEVKKLLDSSYLKSTTFYVGECSNREVTKGRYYTITNVEDWLTGPVKDLMDLSRLGISYDHPSLHMLEAARKQERTNHEKNVGIHQVPQPKDSQGTLVLRHTFISIKQLLILDDIPCKYFSLYAGISLVHSISDIGLFAKYE
jgi:hypothetical protein